MVLDNDTNEANHFNVSIQWAGNEQRRAVKLVSHIWQLDTAGIPQSVLAIGTSTAIRSHILGHRHSCDPNGPVSPIKGLTGGQNGAGGPTIDLTILIEDTTLLPGYGHNQVGGPIISFAINSPHPSPSFFPHN